MFFVFFTKIILKYLTIFFIKIVQMPLKKKSLGPLIIYLKLNGSPSVEVILY